MVDKREEFRLRALKGAKIIFGDPSRVIDCTIRNRTAAGAQLAVPSTVGIPDRFDLVESATGERHSAVVMWRRLGLLGVRLERA